MEASERDATVSLWRVDETKLGWAEYRWECCRMDVEGTYKSCVGL